MASQAPFNVYVKNEISFALHSHRRLSHPSGIPWDTNCTNMAFELDPIDLQTADIAEWVDILRDCSYLDIDTLTRLKIQHAVTENKVWFIDIQQKRSQRAAEKRSSGRGLPFTPRIRPMSIAIDTYAFDNDAW